ncbi:ABC transporter permease [Denitratimonas tolerans]|jgi:ABC-2 type transport system permease protein|uniref:ABC transporter permease n=2 Tax=Denitratimonas tolerans TaxID=1338420 RepID=A0AAW9R4W9_9GAMM
MMNALAQSGPAHSPWRAYRNEARCEFIRLWRTPAFSLPVLLFPAMFYVLFGVLLSRGSGDAATFLLATYGVFGVMGVALFGFGVVVAEDREQGLLTLKRAMPMPRGAYLFAKMAMAALFAAIVSLLLMALAATLGGVALAPWQWLGLFAINVAGVLPFAALGMWLGTHFSGAASVGVINMVYLPMALLSGLWMPLSMLPGIFTTLAPLWPAWHLSQLSLKLIGADAGMASVLHIAVLVALTALFFFLALRRLAR